MLNENYMILNTLFQVSFNVLRLYLPTLIAQPLSTASFPALRKLQWELLEWTRQQFNTVCFHPKCNSWQSDMPIEFSDVLPLQVILHQSSEYEPYKTILSIISWKNTWYLLCISFSGSWTDVKLTALCRDEHRPLADKWERGKYKWWQEWKMSKNLLISFLFM